MEWPVPSHSKGDVTGKQAGGRGEEESDMEAKGTSSGCSYRLWFGQAEKGGAGHNSQQQQTAFLC